MATKGGESAEFTMLTKDTRRDLLTSAAERAGLGVTALSVRTNRKFDRR